LATTKRDDIRLTDAIGRQQETTIVNEFGLYLAILPSDKPSAKPFQKWVAGTEPPSLRKSDGYIAGRRTKS